MFANTAPNINKNKNLLCNSGVNFYFKIILNLKFCKWFSKKNYLFL